MVPQAPPLCRRNPDAPLQLRNVYNTSALVDPSGGTTALSSTAAYSIPDIMAAYLDRNETTYLDTAESYWQPGGSSPFTMRVRIRVPQNLVTYKPHIFEMLKFGWIQWLATYVLVR